MYIPEVFLVCFRQIPNNRLQFYLIMSYENFMVSALSTVKTIELSTKSVRNSVIARVRNSGGHFQSNHYNFRRDLNFVRLIASVRDSGVSARRESTVLLSREGKFSLELCMVPKTLSHTLDLRLPPTNNDPQLVDTFLISSLTSKKLTYQ